MGCNCGNKTVTSYYINCGGCGIKRILTYGLQAGDPVNLDPCPKCGDTIVGIFDGKKVVETIEDGE